MDFCLVFTPDNPEIYTLNPSAWLIMRLCDGKPEADIAHAYHATVEPLLSREEARREVRAGIASLVKMGIVELASARRGKRSNPKPSTRGSRRETKRSAAA